MKALAILMVVLAFLSLGCLLLIRTPEGGLKPHGFFLFGLFGVGSASCLYMLLSGVGS